MKYIFLDVDGTLCMPGNEPSEKTIYAIKQARKNGHKVFVCTGRNKIGIKKILPIGFDGFVASAGGYVEVNGHKIFDVFIEQEEVDFVRKVFEKNNVYYDLEGTNITFQSKEMLQLFAFGKIQQEMNSEMKRMLLEHQQTYSSHLLEEYDGKEPIHKICFIAKTIQDLEEPKKILGEKYDFIIHDIFSGNTINGEIIDKRINKGIGIDHVIHYYGEKGQTIGFGDSLNDLQMIQRCDIGVVMGNGSDQLKEHADIICESVDNEGIYQEFIKLGLIKEKSE